MSGKEHSEFAKFDRVMSGLLAVPYKELQEELAKDRKKKARKKKSREMKEQNDHRDADIYKP